MKLKWKVAIFLIVSILSSIYLYIGVKDIIKQKKYLTPEAKNRRELTEVLGWIEGQNLTPCVTPINHLGVCISEVIDSSCQCSEEELLKRLERYKRRKPGDLP